MPDHSIRPLLEQVGGFTITILMFLVPILILILL
mgnify:FL=1|jgi:hypothetical protein